MYWPCVALPSVPYPLNALPPPFFCSTKPDPPAEQFALTEVAYITVRLLQEFSGIESRDPEPWREKILITVTGLGGCKVVLTPREG